jgi:alpha-aminoadipic semialdehyde synthase
LKRHFPTVETPYTGFAFEGLANRNALDYVNVYGLGQLSDMDTMFRGTLRFKVLLFYSCVKSLGLN